MSEETALRAAIIAEPDEDTPRLAYADWLDENKPDRIPSSAAGPSARAEFIRTQCRLAAGAFDDPDYPELLEREADLAVWLNTHDPEPDPKLRFLSSPLDFECGEWGSCRRGFPEVVDFGDYAEGPDETVDAIVAALTDGFTRHPGRTLSLEEATSGEIALLARQPSFEQLRGLYLDYLDYLDSGSKDEAVAAVAGSPRARGLRRLYLDFQLEVEGCEALARSPHLGNLESLAIDYPSVSVKSIKAFGRSKWFRNLHRLHVWLSSSDALRALADLPPLPRLKSLTLSGTMNASPASVRRFAASGAFPNLAHLDLRGTHLSADQVVLLARGRWPLRHLRISRNEVRKAGAEALATANFAPTLRILELPDGEITAGGVQALAESDSLTNLRHLDLSENPVGPGGLAAIADSPALRVLRCLDLRQTNTARGPLAARDVLQFLTSLAMPNLTHLRLNQLPVGIRGATVLARSPFFAGLTWLQLGGCGLGERGTKQLILSKTLTKLVVLDVSGTRTGNGAGRLANPKTLPRLANCYLGHGIPKATATRLRRRPGIQV